MYLEI